MFFLRNRRPDRYGADLAAQLKPGHPLYEKIKKEVLDEYESDDAEVDAEVFASIDKFIDDMRVRRLANGQILVETGGAEDGKEPDAEDERGDGAEPAARRGPSIRSL